MADNLVTSTGDRLVTTVPDNLVTDQVSAVVIPAGTLVTLDQSVVEFIPAGTLATFRQIVRIDPVVIPAGTLATLSQSVIEYSVIPAGTLVTFRQQTEEVIAAGTLVAFRQRVLTAAQAATPTTFVTLAGQDITANVAPAIAITATEGDNRTAALRLRALPAGPLDVPGYEGKSLVITRLIGGSPVVMFSGQVSKPVWDRDNRQLVLECSDFRNRRIGREDHDRLIAMTGGLYSPITQREDATGSDWVRELMKTVPGTLDYASNGVLQYHPWATSAPSHVLTDADVYYEDISLEFGNSDEIRNTVPATLEYRYFRRNAISHAVSLAIVGSEYCKLAGCTPASTVIVDGQPVPQIIPTKAAILSAAEGVSNWRLVDLQWVELPPDGWYRRTSDVTRKIAYGASEAYRAAHAAGADLTLERYISQPLRETYSLTITAPESIDRYGEVRGDELRFSAETRVDGSIYEDRGCTVVVDPDDRRADVEFAIQCIQRMGKKQILATHRQNFAEVIRKGEYLPVEIGQTVSLATGDFDVLGNITEFQHATDDRGDIFTSLKLAVSRVESAVVVTEDWTLPAAPTSFALNSDSQSLPATPTCPAPSNEAEVSGPSRLEPDGTVVITAPQIDRSQVDEIIGERAVTYPVKIPKDLFTLEVPAR